MQRRNEHHHGSSTTQIPRAVLVRRVFVCLPDDPEAVFVVAGEHVRSLPPHAASPGRARGRSSGVARSVWTACPGFAVQPDGGCPRGEHCPFAHVEVALLRSPDYRRHIAPSDGSPATYERFPATTGRLALQAPNRPGTVLDIVASDECLRTRALEAPSDALTHCAHWLLKGQCVFGAACKFVHVVQASDAARAFAAVRIDSSRAKAAQDETSGTSASARSARSGSPSLPPPRLTATGMAPAAQYPAPPPSTAAKAATGRSEASRPSWRPYQHRPYEARPVAAARE